MTYLIEVNLHAVADSCREVYLFEFGRTSVIICKSASLIMIFKVVKNFFVGNF